MQIPPATCREQNTSHSVISAALRDSDVHMSFKHKQLSAQKEINSQGVYFESSSIGYDSIFDLAIAHIFWTANRPRNPKRGGKLANRKEDFQKEKPALPICRGR